MTDDEKKYPSSPTDERPADDGRSSLYHKTRSKATDKPRSPRSFPKGPKPGPGQEGRDRVFDRAAPPARRAPDGREGPKGAAAALIELDRDLMKLLVRRATLVSRIREGKDQAASPAAAQAEKAVRIAWETGALAFSKDPLFSRQLFSLLQDIKVLSKEQAGQAGSFHLSPAQKPVSGVLTGPSSARTAQMRLALSACLGKKLVLSSAMLSQALHDTCKACEQAGAKISRLEEKPGLCSIQAEAGPPLVFTDKSLYLGDDLFTLYLLIFLALGQTGVCRLNGGARLKAADLSALRHTLPLFGARLAPVVPRSHGLPASLECSGIFPPYVTVPADLPPEALSALLLAPVAWNAPITLDLSALPAATATAALAEVRPLHRDCGAEVDSYGPKLIFTPSSIEPPVEPRLPLEPVLSAFLLCVPAFAGGSIRLNGLWPGRMPEAAEAEQLFAWAGLEFRSNENWVETRLPLQEEYASGQSRPAFSMPMQSDDISPVLGPLYLVLSALCLKRTGAMPPLRQLLAFPAEDTDIVMAQDFFSRLGLVYEDDRLARAGAAAEEPPPGWTSPDAYWSMAYALGAYLRPGLQLANPGNVGEIMPPFWGIYNSLPDAKDPAGRAQAAQEDTVERTARRRIIAD